MHLLCLPSQDLWWEETCLGHWSPDITASFHIRLALNSDDSKVAVVRGRKGKDRKGLIWPAWVWFQFRLTWQMSKDAFLFGGFLGDEERKMNFFLPGWKSFPCHSLVGGKCVSSGWSFGNSSLYPSDAQCSFGPCSSKADPWGGTPRSPGKVFLLGLPSGPEQTPAHPWTSRSALTP